MSKSLFILAVLSLLPLSGSTAAPARNPADTVVLAAGPEWIPLRPELNIEPRSALDFTGMGFVDAPAGKYGRVVATRDGQFAFEKSPNKERRFYGVNLCFGAHYLSHERADELAERLVRLGYNALRVHHYERDLVQGQPRTTEINPAKLESFDYLMAALIKRGIYLTTDLYVSRPVPYREIGIEKDGNVPMNTFKILVPVHQGAYENWKSFSRALLTHVNPYTGRSYAKEPALAWLAMINEGNFGNFFSDIKSIPEWKQAWNRWLGSKYASRQMLAATWNDLKPQESPADGTVELPDKLQMEGTRARDCIMFLADTERDMVTRMKRFLNAELGCRALVSNASSWTRFTTDQGAREVYDYVDDHFYVDHPQFLEGSWRLPSRCSNTSPLAEGAPGGRAVTFTRLFDKPFTLTEYNYSGPGRFRGVGGILTGAMGSLQGWGGIWRFAYSHSADAMFTPSRMGYFDLASDPLSQAAERASLLLFLRQDLKTAPHKVGISMTAEDLANPATRIPTLAPKWHWLAWVTRVGTDVGSSPVDFSRKAFYLPVGWKTPASEYRSSSVIDANPYLIDDATLISSLDRIKLFAGTERPRPGDRFFQSETGEVTINGPENKLVLDTSRTAGGFAPAGESFTAENGGVTIRVVDADATVWVSALDDREIRNSRRLLVTHLTDLQNTGIRYGEVARQTLLEWGALPHLVRAGKADVSVRLQSVARYKVWALSPSGRRLALLPTTIEGGALKFTADVAGDASAGARMLYELARE